MVQVFLMHGFIGAGKTTVAKAIEVRTGAVRLTHDAWMARLYGSNPPADQFAMLSDRVSAALWDLTAQLVARGVSVILDFGFWSRVGRDTARECVLAMGAQAVWVAVACPLDVMKARAIARTESLPEEALVITDATFQTLLQRFEPLGSDEPHVLVSTNVAYGEGVSLSGVFSDV